MIATIKIKEFLFWVGVVITDICIITTLMGVSTPEGWQAVSCMCVLGRVFGGTDYVSPHLLAAVIIAPSVTGGVIVMGYQFCLIFWPKLAYEMRRAHLFERYLHMRLMQLHTCLMQLLMVVPTVVVFGWVCVLIMDAYLMVTLL